MLLNQFQEFHIEGDHMTSHVTPPREAVASLLKPLPPRGPQGNECPTKILAPSASRLNSPDLSGFKALQGHNKSGVVGGWVPGIHFPG